MAAYPDLSPEEYDAYEERLDRAADGRFDLGPPRLVDPAIVRLEAEVGAEMEAERVALGLHECATCDRYYAEPGVPLCFWCRRFEECWLAIGLSR